MSTLTATPDAIDRELPCAGCGYDLRGLSPGGHCPECGGPVARALAFDTLHHADPRWLRRLIAAGWWGAGGVAAVVTVHFASWPLIFGLSGRRPTLIAVVNGTMDVMSMAALAVGPALLARPPLPARFDDAPRRRRALSALLAAVLVCTAVQAVVFAVNSMGWRGGATPAPAAWFLPVVMTLSLVLAASLGGAATMTAFLAAGVMRRVPRSSLGRWFRGTAWCVAVGFVLLTSLVAAPAAGWQVGRNGTLWGNVGVGFMVAGLTLGYGGVLALAVLGVVAAVQLRAVRDVAVRLHAAPPASADSLPSVPTPT
ncbi:MAG TPA: hypothetical protein VK324_10155 [Tepidisphaeraceae bacterium]|nr:hypothetical protein [Tepidisphaeraceae bacterium]